MTQHKRDFANVNKTNLCENIFFLRKIFCENIKIQKEVNMNLIKKMASSIEKQKRIIEKKQAELKFENDKLNSLINQPIKINLGELKNELQAIFKNKCNILVEYKIVSTSGRNTADINTVEQFINQVGYDGFFLKSTILISYTQPTVDQYKRYIYFKDLAHPNMSDVQNDGKTLAEHCSLVSFVLNDNGDVKKELAVDKDIDDVNIGVTYADIVNKNAESQPGAKLLNTAIINLLKNQAKKQKELQQ